MVKVLIVSIIFAVLALADAQSTWENYKAKHGKHYANNTEHAKRQAIFQATHDHISQHNVRYAAGKETYEKGHNFFSDLTQEEKNSYMGIRMNQTAQVVRSGGARNWERASLPASYDLRTSPCLPAIKPSQGGCGDCYTFAATTPLEYQYCMKTGVKVVLSEQQLTDCTYASPRDGCTGGWYHDCWTYVMQAGQELIEYYPWKAATKSATCSYSSNSVRVGVSSFSYVDQCEPTIQSRVVSNGPISVAIWASNNFTSYKSGIYTDSSCPTDMKTVNHAVTIVGYGTSGSTPYWIVRNSWGSSSWGLSGYMLMQRGVNMCNIAAYAAYPTVL